MRSAIWAVIDSSPWRSMSDKSMVYDIAIAPLGHIVRYHERQDIKHSTRCDHPLGTARRPDGARACSRTGLEAAARGTAVGGDRGRSDLGGAVDDRRERDRRPVRA